MILIMKILLHNEYIKSSICGIQHTCINFLIFLIITKIECWPVFKQDPNWCMAYSTTGLFIVTTGGWFFKVSRKMESCIMNTSHVLIINRCYFSVNRHQICGKYYLLWSHCLDIIMPYVDLNTTWYSNNLRNTKRWKSKFIRYGSKLCINSLFVSIKVNHTEFFFKYHPARTNLDEKGRKNVKKVLSKFHSGIQYQDGYWIWIWLISLKSYNLIFSNLLNLELPYAGNWWDSGGRIIWCLCFYINI